MRRFLSVVFAILMACGAALAQSMSDSQVLQYIQQANSQGKNQQQITTELMRRGVTQEQLLRIRDKYSNSKNNASDAQTGTATGATRMRDSQPVSRRTQKSNSSTQTSRNGRTQGTSNRKSYIQGESRFDVLTNAADTLNTYNQDIQNSMNPYDIYGLPLEEEIDPTEQIFGHNIFDNENLTFEPSVNIATPANYRLGPGDEVIIDIWGASESTIRETISPDGTIQVSNLGPVYLNGKTVAEAGNYMKQELSKIYSGISDANPTTFVNFTLGSNRSITVNVMGEVQVPGTYTLSAFASVFHALYAAGGVNDIGSLRAIEIVRNNKPVATVDIYQYILEGKLTGGERLQEGDVVIVPTYQSLVQMLGKVKRPMFYEMKTGETMKTAIDFAGGFTGDAYKKALRVERKSSGRERQIYNVDEMNFSVFRLDDGDVITADSVLERYENRVEIRGAVYREGAYELDGKTNTVRRLIEKAEGLRGDAFRNRAILDREKDDYNHEIISIDIQGLMDGTVADVPLKRNDVLYIPTIQGLEEQRTVAIHGEVANEGTYLFSDNMTVEDIVVMAGGLLESAASTNVSVTRRIKNPGSKEFNSVMGETFSFDIDQQLFTGGKPFYLQPFDEVYVRKSPAYREQQNITVSGEVLFGGTYALTSKNERLSDIIGRAGGVTPDAYVKGARLIRQMSEEEVTRQEDALRMTYATASQDSIDLMISQMATTYTVGINLEKALSSPKSDYDLVLRNGDELVVPEYTNTVKISGAVMYPNTVFYKADEGLRYYISQAGGYAMNAKRGRAYVVHLNGTVSRLKRGGSKYIEPGSEIIVPERDMSRRTSLAEIMSMSSAGASMAAVIASIVSLFR